MSKDDRWKRVKQSSLKIDTTNSGSSNLFTDWSRASASSVDPSQPTKILINGKPLANYADFKIETENQTDNEIKNNKNNLIENFFKNVILKEMCLDDEDKTKKILEYLKSNFHQGALMHPVSATIATSITDPTGNNVIASIVKPVLTVNIVPTKNGFTIQEDVVVTTITVTPGSEQYFDNVNEDTTLKMKDESPIIIATGKLEVDLRNDQPKVTILHNAIHTDNPQIEKYLDKRNFFQKIYDFLKEVLGLSTKIAVEPIKQKDPEPDNGHSPTITLT